MSASEEMETPHLPTSYPQRPGSPHQSAHEGWKIERDRESSLALAQQIEVALIGLSGVANPENWRMVSLPRYIQ